MSLKLRASRDAWWQPAVPPLMKKFSVISLQEFSILASNWMSAKLLASQKPSLKILLTELNGIFYIYFEMTSKWNRIKWMISISAIYFTELIINWTLRSKVHALENVTCKMVTILWRPHCVSYIIDRGAKLSLLYKLLFVVRFMSVYCYGNVR